MNYETKYDITECISSLLATDEFRCFENDLLIDVFGVWDCYAQDWLPDSPLLLRFESDDALVRLSGEDVFSERKSAPVARLCEVTFGSVDTFTPINPASMTIRSTAASEDEQASATVSPQEDGEDACLCWLRIKC